jgi:glutamyl/glutaminyl-tRNA synthetase
VPYLIDAGLIEKVQSSKFKVQSTREEISFDYLKQVVALEQERMKRLSEIGELVRFIFVNKLEYDKNLLVWRKMSLEEVKNNLELIYRELEKINEKDFTKNNLEKVLGNLMKEKNIKTGELLWPLRVALTGLKGSPGPFEIGEVLGKEKVLGRIREGIKEI